MNQNDKNIDNALIETLRVHPDYSRYLVSLLFDNSTTVVNFRNFTSHNGARQLISGVETKDFIKYILKKSLALYEYIDDAYLEFALDGKESLKLPSNFQKIGEYFSKFYNTDIDINSIIYFQLNPNELLPFIQFVVDGYFKANSFYDLKGNCYTNAPIDELLKFGQELDTLLLSDKMSSFCRKIEEDYQVAKKMSNLEFNQFSVNECLKEIVTGKQLVNKSINYQVGDNLYASQDIGNKRLNQEDSVLIMEHPEISDFKFLVVSDGICGGKKGEIASHMVVKDMAKWFNVLPKELYSYPEKLQELFSERIKKVSNNIYRKLHGKGGATLVSAIITKDKTLISNVGDSRAMTLKWNKLNLVTEDDSSAFKATRAYKGKKLSEREIEQLRFNRYSNEILKYMGEKELDNIQSYIINNRSYDKLFLFSDGITDLLTFDKIKLISRTTKPEFITKTLVETTLETNAINPELDNDEAYKYIPAGKDNATAAMYSRR